MKKSKNLYYFRVFAECGVDCRVEAENKLEALINMNKIMRGKTFGVDFQFNGMDLGSLISVERIEKIFKRDPKTGKRTRNKILLLSKKEWKILRKY